jgi:hypothetical protein
MVHDLSPDMLLVLGNLAALYELYGDLRRSASRLLPRSLGVQQRREPNATLPGPRAHQLVGLLVLGQSDHAVRALAEGLHHFIALRGRQELPAHAGAVGAPSALGQRARRT